MSSACIYEGIVIHLLHVHVVRKARMHAGDLLSRQSFSDEIFKLIVCRMHIR